MDPRRRWRGCSLPTAVMGVLHSTDPDTVVTPSSDLPSSRAARRGASAPLLTLSHTGDCTASSRAKLCLLCPGQGHARAPGGPLAEPPPVPPEEVILPAPRNCLRHMSAGVGTKRTATFHSQCMFLWAVVLSLPRAQGHAQTHEGLGRLASGWPQDCSLIFQPFGSTAMGTTEDGERTAQLPQAILLDPTGCCQARRQRPEGQGSATRRGSALWSHAAFSGRTILANAALPTQRVAGDLPLPRSWRPCHAPAAAPPLALPELRLVMWPHLLQRSLDLSVLFKNLGPVI